MTDTLWGVVIGGTIGLIGSLIVGLGQHRRWQKEFAMQYLLTERDRREELRDRIARGFIDLANSDTVKHSFFREFATRLPNKLTQFLGRTYAALPFMSHDEKRKAISSVCIVLELYVGLTDKDIKGIVGKTPHDSSDLVNNAIEKYTAWLEDFSEDTPQEPNTEKAEDENPTPPPG